MNLSRQRVFIKNLPETATQDEITTTFSEYGKVASVELKERKDANLANQSQFFAYVNIEIDDSSLQKCFQDFGNELWHGQYVELQIAKESFLERLKRERAESGRVERISSTAVVIPEEKVVENGVTKRKAVTKSSSSEGESSSEEEKDLKKKTAEAPKKAIKESSSESDSSSEEETTKKIKIDPPNDYPEDIVIKSNKHRKLSKGGLKIESTGNKPIFEIQVKKKTKNGPLSVSENKRIQSMNQMIKGYQQQKLAIKNALSSVDNKVKNRITFGDSYVGADNKVKTIYKKQSEYTNGNTNTLFESDAESDEDNYNFEVKNQFEGKKGQKLMELQSKYKNDKRFMLDERFADEQVPEENNYNGEDMSLEDEKRKQFEILDQVLGGKGKSTLRAPRERLPQKAMLRYDPTQPDHEKYEIKSMEVPTKDKRKNKKNKKEETLIEIDQPEVSKEVFYKVSDNLKETLQETQGFSLLNMFGTVDESAFMQDKELPTEIKKKKILGTERNPFRYDSSDDENEEMGQETSNAPKKPTKTSAPIKLWSEPFFFKEDDYRLQEGHDFFMKIASEEKVEFGQLRRSLKEIVRAKIRNTQRKNKPFKKKLGGNKRRKLIKIKKAMKR